MLKHFIYKICTILLVSLLISGCNSEEDILNKNKLIVATSADNPPYEYIKDGVIIGLDIDVINAIGKEIGKKIVIKNLDFPALLPALNTNNVDLVIAALTTTEERKKYVSFSESYYNTSMALLFKKTKLFHSIDDVAQKLIGVQSGTIWESYLKELNNRIDSMRIRSLSNNLVLLEELKAENIDALLLEEMQALKFQQNIPELTSFTIPNTNSSFAIALPQNSELLPLINNAIKKLEAEGVLKQIRSKWLDKL